MKDKIVQRIRKISSAQVLAIMFLAFSVYVGIAAIPQFISNTGIALCEEKTFDEYTELINEQYHGMLLSQLDQPYLHDKGTYINFNGLMANVLNQIEMNKRIKLKNGHLAQFDQELPDHRMGEIFQSMKSLSDMQISNNRDFLFVLAPSQSYQQEELFPIGYEDHLNENSDYLIALMEKNGIAYLDLRKSMAEEGMTNTEAFFVTDHHWTPQTGFWSYGKIVEELHRNGAIDQINTFYIDPENYDFRIYQDVFLGSSGKRTGKYFAGLDDFCVISPKYETNIAVQIETNKYDASGSFCEVAYNKWALERLGNSDYFNQNSYGIYGWGDRPLTRWRNENAPEDMQVMLIGDSFGNVPFSFLSLYFTSCDELDMRHFEDDFQSFYEENTPDIIILLVNPTSFGTANTQYTFFSE